MTAILKSKTIWMSIIVTVSGALLAYMPLLQKEITPTTYGYIMMALGVVQAIFRVLTTKPLKDK